MANKHAKALGVSTPEGERLYAIVTSLGDNIHIEVRFLEAVQKAAPPFAQNGVIRFTVKRDKYKTVIKQLEEYLESVILKGMAENDDLYTSLGIEASNRRDKKPRKTGYTKKPIGEGDTASVHGSARRDEQAEDSGKGQSSSDMAEGGNQGASEQD